MALSDKAPAPPDSPAEAFTQFVEFVRNCPQTFDGVSVDDVIPLLRPFIVNPARNEAAVCEIAEFLVAVRLAPVFAGFNRLARLLPGSRLRGTFGESRPDTVERLRRVETLLKTNLLPGRLTVYLPPIQYLQTPQSYGHSEFHRYRVIVQTIADPAHGDSLTSVAIEVTVSSSDDSEIVVDAISPQPGFSVVGLTSTNDEKHGVEETTGEKEAGGSELSVTGAKVSSSIETSRSFKQSTLISIGMERTVARVEQYLIARKAGNRATWRALAGVGPIDASGIEYTLDLLVPDAVSELQVRVDARVDWAYGGTVPAEINRTLPLPRPQRVKTK